MSVQRYNNNQSFVTPPLRKIIPSQTDILHTLKMGERIDNLAYKYYKDSNLSWVIMYGNTQYDNEFEMQYGDVIRIPFPINRIFDQWQVTNSI